MYSTRIRTACVAVWRWAQQPHSLAAAALLFVAANAPALLAQDLCSTEVDVALEESVRHDQGIGIDPTYDRHFQEFNLRRAAHVSEVGVLISRATANTDRGLMLNLFSVDAQHEPAVPIAGTTVSLPAAAISDTTEWVQFTLDTPVLLQSGRYAVHLQLGPGSATVGYHWAREYDAADPYPPGISGYWYPFVGGKWVTTQELDNAFRVFGCPTSTASVPATGPIALAALLVLLAGVAAAVGYRRAR